jgi:hypothetical protein
MNFREGYLGLQYCNTVQYNTIQYNTIHAVVKWLKNGHVTHIANTGDGTLRITSNPVANTIHGTKVVPRATVLEQTGSDSKAGKDRQHFGNFNSHRFGTSTTRRPRAKSWTGKFARPATQIQLSSDL